jgi:hypothetical protein
MSDVEQGHCFVTPIRSQDSCLGQKQSGLLQTPDCKNELQYNNSTLKSSQRKEKYSAGHQLRDRLLGQAE